MAFSLHTRGPLFTRSDHGAAGAFDLALATLARSRSIHQRPSSLPLIPDLRVMAGHPGMNGTVRNLGGIMMSALGGKA